MFSIFTEPSKEVIAVKKILPAGGKNFTLVLADYTDGGGQTQTDRVYSCQPDGRSDTRDPGANGSYERCRIAGSVATFRPAGGKYYTKTFVEVDGL